MFTTSKKKTRNPSSSKKSKRWFENQTQDHLFSFQHLEESKELSLNTSKKQAISSFLPDKIFESNNGLSNISKRHTPTPQQSSH